MLLKFRTEAKDEARGYEAEAEAEILASRLGFNISDYSYFRTKWVFSSSFQVAAPCSGARGEI